MMDGVYDFVESIHVFIPIIAVVLLVIIVYFAGTTGKGAQPPEDYIQRLKNLEKERKKPKPAAAPSKPSKSLPSSGTYSVKEPSASPNAKRARQVSVEKEEPQEPALRQRKGKDGESGGGSLKGKGKHEHHTSEDACCFLPEKQQAEVVGQWTTVTPKKRKQAQASSSDKENSPVAEEKQKYLEQKQTPKKEKIEKQAPLPPSFGDEDENWNKPSVVDVGTNEKQSPKKGKKSPKVDGKQKSPAKTKNDVDKELELKEIILPVNNAEPDLSVTPTPPVEDEGWQTQSAKGKKKGKKKEPQNDFSVEPSGSVDLYREADIQPPSLGTDEKLKIGTDDPLIDWSSSGGTNTDSGSPKQAPDSSSTSAVLVSELSEQPSLEEVEENGVVVVSARIEGDGEDEWTTQEDKKKKKRRKKKGKKDKNHKDGNTQSDDEDNSDEDTPWETETGKSLSAADGADATESGSPSSANQRKRRPRRE